MLKIYNQYQEHGVSQYYKQFSSSYTNPHQEKIKNIYQKYFSKLVSRNDKILDIACGDGLMYRIIKSYQEKCIIEGTDPFFDNIYCNYKFSFEDIALGKLENTYNIAFCCYAFHLLDETWKYDFLFQLARITNKFIIITPSKKIIINHPSWKTTLDTRDDKITIIVLEKVLSRI